jgi:hypothetical protein
MPGLEEKFPKEKLDFFPEMCPAGVPVPSQLLNINGE